MEKDKKEIKVRRPSFFLYTLPVLLVGWYFRLKWRAKIDKSGLKGVKGPILCLGNHSSTVDIILSMLALVPRRFNIVTGRDLFTWKILRPFIKGYGAIPKNQCSIDLNAMRTMKAGAEQGRNILIYPEGRTSLDGRGIALAPSIAKFIKFMDCDLAILHTDGCFLTHPRWFHGQRRGRINTKVYLLHTRDEIRKMGNKELYEEVSKALKFNDNIYQRENGIRFKTKEPAHNLNYILYKCPKCGAEYENYVEEGRYLCCKQCGNKVEYTEYGELVPQGDSKSFDRIDLWYDYEKESARKEMEEPDFNMTREVTLRYNGVDSGEFVDKGEGVFFMNDKEIGYKGTFDGKEISVAQELKTLNTIVTKNYEAVDLTFEDGIYRFVFKDHKWSVKYCLAVEENFLKTIRK